MTGTDAATAFHAMVARYEHDGWAIRTLNRTELRATVRAGASHNGGRENGPAPPRPSVCRRLWVDAQGLVQETDVPC
jgi:hypothetical protein